MINVDAMLYDSVAAAQSYTLTGQRGSLLALHRVAHLAVARLGTRRSCLQECSRAQRLVSRVDHRTSTRRLALAMFSRMASICIESAQLNAAHLLSKLEGSEIQWLDMPPAKSRLQKLADLVNMSALEANASLHFIYAYINAPRELLRVDDFNNGRAGNRVDKFEAAVFYQLAFDLRNTQAIFNLGVMHEAGDNVEQDYHLAKRFFVPSH
jgi:TPR repeat protein